MSILVNLTPTEEARLSSVAMQSGIAPAELAAKLLREHLTSTPTSTADLVRAKLHLWQKETATKTSPATSAHELFTRWAEEDSHMSEEEKAAEDRLWQDFEKSVNETRSSLGMRQL